MSNLWTVVRFTFLTRLRAKSFIVTSIIFALLISVGVHVPFIIKALNSSSEAETLGVLDRGTGFGALLENYFEGQEEPGYKIVPIQDTGSAEGNDREIRRLLKDGEVEAVLELTPDPAGGWPKATYKSEKAGIMGNDDLYTALQAVKMQKVVQDLKLSSEQLTKLNTPIVLDSVQTSDSADGGKSQEEIAVATVLIYVLLILLFIGVIGYGNMVATEITAEKSSRVMEILVTTVSPLQAMFGKIIAVCMLGAAQIAAFIGVALFNYYLPHNQEIFGDLNFDIGAVPVMLWVYFIFFYVLGFLLYGTLLAAVGSLVSRTEELGQAIMPVTFLSVAGFYIGMFGLSSPHSLLIKVTSFIPFFTPMIMFLRAGLTSVPAWVVWLSIVELAVSVYLVGWLSAKVYRAGVLLYGKKPGMKELLKAMRAFKV
ncbi:ABC transporter permease [Paenibacillus thermoaerophilus]|uniref:ABC transporter permease n=1 Tax=Paenibacillus thermoaerophilus TaxID=1215385 RepID=A0ABW2V3Y3_9BACL|nr:ABC transporter permease [Paenibacillus thermoaerophilus]